MILGKTSYILRGIEGLLLAVPAEKRIGFLIIIVSIYLIYG